MRKLNILIAVVLLIKLFPIETVTASTGGKILLFPDGLHGQNQLDFYNEESQWNVYYMFEGKDIAILWDKAFGKDPRIGNSVVHRRFDPETLMRAAQGAYDFIRQQLKFATLPNTNADKYKFLLFVRNDDKTSALGGGYKGIPILWLSPSHAHESFDPNFKYVYHEMGHCFQKLASFDGASSLNAIGNGKNINSFAEMISQWVLLRRYPDWMHQEPHHFKAYMENTHLALAHFKNAYRNPYILEYWATKHGVHFISHIWQHAEKSDESNFIKAYMRLSNIDQKSFNAEIYDAFLHFVTWDLPHIDKEYNKYGASNIHQCELVEIKKGTYEISKRSCPQNYAYNVICLKDYVGGTKVKVKLRGILEDKKFNIKNKKDAEWRWGFVALLEDGTRIYSDNIGIGISGKTNFTVPKNTKYLWLVVVATPKIYRNEFDNEWPYAFSIIGAQPDGNKCKLY